MWLLLPVIGFAAFVWFLIRVIPKPTRATYPCQRMAFPLASGFIAWLLGLAVSLRTFRTARISLARRKYLAAAMGLFVSIAALWITMSLTNEKMVLAQEPTSNQPIGVAQGVNPGRVVWVHDPDATDWQGPGNGNWWRDGHTDQAHVNQMMSKAVQNLTGASSDKQAWDMLFRYHNKAQGKGDVGYKQGEKVAIKVNFVGFLWGMGTVDARTYELKGRRDYMNTSPQMMLALLKQLVETVGVRQSDITLSDTIAYFAKEYYEILHNAYPDVRYADYGGKNGCVQAKPSDVPFYWSCKPEGVKQDYIPNYFAQAQYIVNLANLKAHTGAGVTLCTKNHYGSLCRTPVERGFYNMHPSAFSKETGVYRALVDLMGHSHIGGKTVLYLLDGLYSGRHPKDAAPLKWKSAPFNGDWTSSLFASQDPVAIDSVGLDFLRAEYKDMPHMVGTDDYLHEAALADNPPSGTFYDPDHKDDVKRLSSLGVYEHWNNNTDKKYSRNLGKGKGIEMVAITPTNNDKKQGIIADGAKVVELADGFEFTEGPAVDSEGNVFFTDQPNNRIWEWTVDQELVLWHENPGRANGTYFDRHGNLLTCSDEDNQLWLIDKKGNVKVLVKDYKGKKLNGPNDLWERPTGGIYFTDPFYKRPYWNRGPIEQDGQHVYYLSPDNKTLVRVAEDLTQPNGIIGTPDGKTLYVADIRGGKTYSYKIEENGTLSNKKLFCSMGSDGMTIDNEGNVYLTGKGVTIFNPQGQQIEHIPIDAGWTANVCFGGKDRHTLFITASKCLYAIQMRVKGVN